MDEKFHIHRVGRDAAVGGLRLKSIFGRELVAPDRLAATGYVSGLLSRQVDFIDCLEWPDSGVVVDLRMAVHPRGDNLPCPLEIGLLCRAPRTPDTTAVANCKRLCHHIQSLVRASFPEYWFQPIAGKKDMARFLMEPQHVVEVLRREDDLALYVPFHRKSAHRLGFDVGAREKPGEPESRIPHGEVYFVYPFAPSLDTMARVARMLIQSVHPVVVSMRLKPTRLVDKEEDAFRHLLASLEAVQNLPTSGATNSWVEEYADLLTLMKRRAANLSEAVTLQLTRFQDTAFEFSISVGSTHPIEDALVQELGAVITRPAASGADAMSLPLAEQGQFPGLVGGYVSEVLEGSALEAARRGFKRFDVVTASSGDSPSDLGRWRRMVSPVEAVSFFRFPVPDETDFPGLDVLKSRASLAPDAVPNDGFVLGNTRCPTGGRPAAVSLDDRRKHLYAVGQTGTGKTTFFEHMILQDIRAGLGVCVIDPHGDLVESLLGKIPKGRIDDVIYFDPAQSERPIGLNLLEAGTADEQYFLVQELSSILLCIAEDPSFVGPMFRNIVTNFAMTLMSNPEDPGTLVEFPRLYSDGRFHLRWLPFVKDPMVELFWKREWPNTTDYHKSELMGYVISKFGPLVGEPTMRNIVGQTRSGLDFKDIMDNRKVLLVNLAKGRLGETSTRVLGMVIMSKIASQAFARVRIPIEKRADFILYVDEFQNLATMNFSTLLSEARKFRLSLMLTNQFLSQVGDAMWARHYGDAVKHALLGNVGTSVVFRIGTDDAEALKGVVAPDFTTSDLINQPNFRACVSTLVDGVKVRPFTIDTIKDDTPFSTQVARRIRKQSLQKYGVPRARIEKQIRKSLMWETAR